MISLLAQTAAMTAPDTTSSWAPVVLLLVIGIGFAIGNIMISVIIGPSRTGPVGDTHKRFNVRFYIVAMIFLVIDVEIVFFYPFATIFAPYVQHDRTAGTHDSLTMLVSILLFVAILLLAYVYAWAKGVFRWD
jgi:NADH-quinone oxidoreductase subunit A